MWGALCVAQAERMEVAQAGEREESREQSRAEQRRGEERRGEERRGEENRSMGGSVTPARSEIKVTDCTQHCLSHTTRTAAS